MLRAFSLAVGQMFSGPILRVLGGSALLSTLTFIGVWYGVDYAVTWLWPSLRDSALVGWMGAFATLALAWFLFPVVASLLISLFLDYVCSAVEKEHYPHLPAASGVTILQSVGVALSYTGALLLVNVLLLTLLFIPPIYAVAWIILNGYLLGREYVELVALRRLSPRDVKVLRRRHRAEGTLTGAIAAFFMTIPLLNLIVPVFTAALTVHRFHDWQGSRSDASTTQ